MTRHDLVAALLGVAMLASCATAQDDARLLAAEARHVGLTVAEHEGASGGRLVVGFDAAGDRIDFGRVPRADALVLRYALRGDRPAQCSLYSGGVDVATVLMTGGAGDAIVSSVVRARIGGSLEIRFDADDLAATGPDRLGIDAIIVGASAEGASGPARVIRVEAGDAAGARRAVADAAPGDVVVLGDGRWSDVRLDLEGRGRPDAPIVVRAGTPGGVVLAGRSSLEIDGAWLVLEGVGLEGVAGDRRPLVRFAKGSHHLRLTRLTMRACNPAPADRGAVRYHWIVLAGRHHRLDHASLAGGDHSGNTLVVDVGAEPGYHLVDHVHFADRAPGVGNGFETIRVGDSRRSMSDERFTLTRCLFERCDGEVEIVSNKSCANVYRYNTFRACSGQLTLRHGNGCLVEGNHFLGEGVRGSSGVRVIGEDHTIRGNRFEGLAGDDNRAALVLSNGVPDSELSGYFRVRRATIAGNLFVGCREAMRIGTSGRGRIEPPLDCVFTANRIARCRDVLVLETAPVRAKWEANRVLDPPDGFEHDGFDVGPDAGLEDDPGGTPLPPALVAADVGPDAPG